MQVRTTEMALRDEWLRDAGLWAQPTRSPVTFRYGDTYFDPQAGWESDSVEVAADHVITHRHPATGLELEVTVTVQPGTSAVEWVPTLRNTGAANTPIIADWQSLDCLTLPATLPVLIDYSNGSQSVVYDFAPCSEQLEKAAQRTFSPGGGRSSNEVLPFFGFHATDGDTARSGVMVAIGWTGEWSMTARHEDGLRLRVGLDQTHFTLHPGEVVRGPRIVLLFCDSDEPRRGGNLLRRYILQHHTPRDGDRPQLPLLSAATWGGTPTDVHETVVKQIAAENIPFEQYWIDAEWYGENGPWWHNVGSWEPNSAKWPDGLRPVSDAIHAAGMRFLLWFEPERVTRDSIWRREHPDWVLRVPDAGRRELPGHSSDPEWPRLAGLRNDFDGDDGLFDLGNDDARTFLIDFLSRRIDEWGIDTYRNDFNFAPLEFWRHNDTPDRQGIRELKYVAGLYEVFDELRRRHPQLRLDNCASGGRRIDVEMLSRADVLSRSDYLDDSIGHQCHTYGLSQWVPVHATLPHTGFSRYAIRSGMTQGLSLSWAMEFNQPETGPMDLDFDQLRRYLDEFEQVRRLFSGDFYPLTTFSTRADDWLGYQFDSPEAGEGLALFFRRDDAETNVVTASLQGLQPDLTYRVWLDAAAPIDQSGRDLQQFEARIDDQPGSLLLRYRRTDV